MFAQKVTAFCRVCYAIFCMRDEQKDAQWIRERIGSKIPEVVYVTHNHYDGGYEVRVGSIDFFVDYESIDANDASHIEKNLLHI